MAGLPGPDAMPAQPLHPRWLPCPSRRLGGGSGARVGARPATALVGQVTDALADRLSHSDVGLGSHGAAVVAVGSTHTGKRDRGRRCGRGPVPTRLGPREPGAPEPGQRAATWLQAAQARCCRSAEGARRRARWLPSWGEPSSWSSPRPSSVGIALVPAVLAAPITFARRRRWRRSRTRADDRSPRARGNVRSCAVGPTCNACENDPPLLVRTDPLDDLGSLTELRIEIELRSGSKGWLLVARLDPALLVAAMGSPGRRDRAGRRRLPRPHGRRNATSRGRRACARPSRRWGWTICAIDLPTATLLLPDAFQGRPVRRCEGSPRSSTAGR